MVAHVKFDSLADHLPTAYRLIVLLASTLLLSHGVEAFVDNLRPLSSFLRLEAIRSQARAYPLNTPPSFRDYRLVYHELEIMRNNSLYCRDIESPVGSDFTLISETPETAFRTLPPSYTGWLHPPEEDLSSDITSDRRSGLWTYNGGLPTKSSLCFILREGRVRPSTLADIKYYHKGSDIFMMLDEEGYQRFLDGAFSEFFRNPP